MSKHRQLIAELVKDGAETRSFRARIMRSVIDSDLDDGRDEAVLEMIGSFPLIPDAFVIDADEQTVTIYEVEVTSPVTESKMTVYCRLWSALDAFDWEMQLVIVGRFGQRYEVDLFDQMFIKRTA